MKKLYLSIIAVGLFVCFSCKKDTFCDVKDPIHDLPWLKEIVKEHEKSHSSLLIYRVVLKDVKTHKRVEGFTIPAPWTNWYNCSGEIICGSGGCDGLGEPCSKYKIIREEQIYESYWIKNRN